MKPKNQKEFNWSYVRFYLMWLLTCLLVLVPLVVFFSGWVNCEDCKRKSSSDKNKVLEKVNYEEVAIGIDSLITIVKAIDINNDSRDLNRTLGLLDDFRDDFLIEGNNELSKKLRTLAAEIYGLTKQYEDSNEKRERTHDQILESKNSKISNLEGDVEILKNQLKNQINR